MEEEYTQEEGCICTHMHTYVNGACINRSACGKEEQEEGCLCTYLTCIRTCTLETCMHR